ncbi:Lrp/AsnC ligand binding domain-containing protein [Nocardioides sp. zg-536]|uniref:Lrp/AsnC ligand binding domain-containing protein n=1 Tax=Nocardioides faecalis TaxID=2803858 RepID=A0A939BUA8_9ACTN|nr:Lrp/AsnC ligand binding domain-containing protein [Nocardioides faecalis]MBM9458666.1 Lrp/AsnC ligand binding domain-containing protein [Nocardioides faecalis]QVI58658.1 Lrp/AsnC ligand binding domain-containing protein [Nocardioides faecalis]
MAGFLALDQVDLALLGALSEHPRAGDLELSRLTDVARATVASRLRRMGEAGVIADWDPTIDVAAAGFEVQAFVTLEISQGALDEVADHLRDIPQVLSASVTTGSGDVLCQVATRSHPELQATLVRIDQSSSVVRSTSVMVLSVLVEPRVLPLLASADPAPSRRAPAYRG